MTGRRNALGALTFISLVLSGTVRGDGDTVWVSDSGLYKVSYTSSLEPIEINRIHEWLLHIETIDGDDVENAEITIVGGMPAHDHGLPTRPRVTEHQGDGNYRVQGIRFHMSGDWEIEITLKIGDRADNVSIELTL
ncbi:MAG: FixH family protein [Proteobacteria bacterium]|nr:FixH family protein [Pseudomonadota bacterium]